MRDSGVKITNREIFDELRQVHSKVDTLNQRFTDHLKDSDAGFIRLGKVEKDVLEIDKTVIKYGILLSIVIGAASFGLQWIFGKVIG